MRCIVALNKTVNHAVSQLHLGFNQLGDDGHITFNTSAVSKMRNFSRGKMAPALKRGKIRKNGGCATGPRCKRNKVPKK